MLHLDIRISVQVLFFQMTVMTGSTPPPPEEPVFPPGPGGSSEEPDPLPVSGHTLEPGLTEPMAGPLSVVEIVANLKQLTILKGGLTKVESLLSQALEGAEAQDTGNEVITCPSYQLQVALL